MHGEGGSEHVLLQQPLYPDLRSLPLSVRRGGEYLVHYPRPVFIRKIRVLVVTTQKPERNKMNVKFNNSKALGKFLVGIVPVLCNIHSFMSKLDSKFTFIQYESILRVQTAYSCLWFKLFEFLWCLPCELWFFWMDRCNSLWCLPVKLWFFERTGVVVQGFVWHVVDHDVRNV